jgi:hypothetical protein
VSVIPKPLATRHLLNPDTAKAAEEAHSNLHWLILSGHFDAAWQITLAMLSPGPWRLSAKSNLLYKTWWFFLWLCDRLHRTRAELDDSGETAQSAIQAFEASKNPEVNANPPLLGLLLSPKDGPSKTNWSRAELDAILATVQHDNFGAAFNAFQRDAELVLDERVRSPDVRTTPLDHGAIADAVEQGARIAFPRDVAVFAMKAAWPAAALDLLDGNRDGAVMRLGRLLSIAKMGSFRDRYHMKMNWMFDPAFADLLASNALAPALGITDTGAGAYLEAFVGRSPYTLKTDVPRPWRVVLRAYAARIKEESIDENALINLEFGFPACPSLLQRALRGQLLNVACSEGQLVALESRLGTKLPPSYREFLQTSNGLAVPNFVSLLPDTLIDWFAKLDQSSAIDAWNHNDIEATEEQYNTYGADQDCIHMRPRHLRTALQISTSIDGDVLLLIPEVRFGEEWEAWFFGSKNPGAYRYRSFRHLIEQCVLAEEGSDA